MENMESVNWFWQHSKQPHPEQKSHQITETRGSWWFLGTFLQHCGTVLLSLAQENMTFFSFFFLMQHDETGMMACPVCCHNTKTFYFMPVLAHMNHNKGEGRLHCSEKSKVDWGFCVCLLVFFFPLEKPFMLQRKEKDFRSMWHITCDHRGKREMLVVNFLPCPASWTSL